MRCLALAPAPRSEVGTRPMPGPEKPAGGGRDGGLSEIISSVYLLRRSSVSSVSSVSLPVNNNSPSESRHNYMMSSQSWSYSISSDNPISARCGSLLSVLSERITKEKYPPYKNNILLLLSRYLHKFCIHI